jgi:hypothetical protein
LASAGARRAASDPHEAEANTVALEVLEREPATTGGEATPPDTPSAGSRLPAEARHHAEALLGHDFASVRVHAGSQGTATSASHNAAAVTAGSDVWFAPGCYRPRHPLGRALIAHELTHVAQQRGAPKTSGPEPRDPVLDHVHALQAGGAVDAGAYQREITAFLASRPWRRRSAAVTALREPIERPPLTPAPSGMRQRTIGCSRGCQTDHEEQTPPPPAQAPPQTPSTGQQQPTPIRVGGVAQNPQATWRIAWTFDDGPTAATPQMVTAVERTGLRGTWFIMRNLLGSGAAYTSSIEQLKRLEQGGHEIAIHSMHPTVSHVCWFPIQSPVGCGNAYTTMAQAMTDLSDFTSLLRSEGLTIRFVRVTTGLVSELTRYLLSGGVQDANRVARRIIGEQLTEEEIVAMGQRAAHVRQVKSDFETLKTTLQSLSLHEWGDRGPGQSEIGAQSWEIESAPTGVGRTDSLTREWVLGRLRSLKRRPTRSGFSVILAHDLARADVEEASRDINAIDELATQESVRVEYYTMSNLFQVVRGQAP